MVISKVRSKGKDKLKLQEENSKTIRYLLLPRAPLVQTSLVWILYEHIAWLSFLFSESSTHYSLLYSSFCILSTTVYFVWKSMWWKFMSSVYCSFVLCTAFKNVYFNNQVKEVVIISSLTSFVCFSFILFATSAAPFYLVLSKLMAI